jgi:hypothetical protein
MIQTCVASTGVVGYTRFKTKTQLVIETRTFGRIYHQSRIRSERGCNVKILRKLRLYVLPPLQLMHANPDSNSDVTTGRHCTDWYLLHFPEADLLIVQSTRDTMKPGFFLLELRMLFFASRADDILFV